MAPAPQVLAPHAGWLRWRPRAGEWALLVLLLAGAWGAYSARIIAKQPLWVLAALVMMAWCTVVLARGIWPAQAGPLGIWARIAVQIAAVTVLLYAIGWGPILAIGYVLIAVDNLSISGSRATAPAEWCAVGAIAVGEATTALGWTPSMVGSDLALGISVLAALGAWLVIHFLGSLTRQREDLEADRLQAGERYEAMVRNSSDIFAIFNAKAELTYLSPAFTRVLGYPAPTTHEGVTIAAIEQYVHDEDLGNVRSLIARAREDAGSAVADEVRLRHAEGGWHWFAVTISNLTTDPHVDGYVANMRDITERHLFEEELEYQAYHDPLTRLPNRVAFLERLDLAIARNRELRHPIAVLFVDVDRFKLVNDSLGHEVGDRLLVEVAERLRGTLRPTDLIARFGGDEFVFILDELRAAADAHHVAERMLEVLRRPILIGGRELFLSSSIGIATWIPGVGDGVTSSDLLRQADVAMYVAKERGRARWEVYDEGAAPELVEQIDLEADLWRATELDELVVHYQPEIDLASDAVVKFEALVRWEHPTRGLLFPDAFIPLAEESELIFAVDAIVLRAACAQVSRWSAERSDRPLGVSVNLSPQSLRRPGAVERIVATLAETGLAPNALQLEITERTALSDDVRTMEALRDLRRAGVRVAIDDFGIGYSALSYLQRFPVDVVKLDRTFIRDISEPGAGRAIVEAMIRMAHALGLRVTAEGVERADQLAVLRELGCDGAQGYHLGKVLEAEECEGLLDDALVVRRVSDAG